VNEQNRLEQLFKLSVNLGTTLDLDHEVLTMMDWLVETVSPAVAALFVTDETKQELRLVGAHGFDPPAGNGQLPIGLDLWRWLEEHGASVPDERDPRRYAVPIPIEQQLWGTLCLVSRQTDDQLSEEQRLVSTAAGYLAPVLRNIWNHQMLEQKVAERTAALAQSEARYRTLVEHASDGIFITDQEGYYVDVNTSGCEMLGYSREELLRMHIRDLIPAEDIAAEPLKLDDIRAGKRVVNRRRLKCKDGHLLPVEISATLLPDGRLLGITRDISQRMQAEEEIRRRNRELALLNRIIAASVSEPKPELILETACRELALAFDVPQAAAALLNEQKTGAVIVAEYLTEGRPSGLNEIIPVEGNPSFQYLLSRKAPLAVDDAQHDPRLAPIHDLMRRRGTVSLLLLPLIVKGEVVGSLGLDATSPRHFTPEEVSLAWNVADQVASALARAWLDEERRRLSAAIEQTAESVVITDTEGTILYVNPAFERTTGYSRAEAVGRNPHILKSGKQDAAFYKELWDTITAGRVWQGRFINRRKDGTLYIEDATITPVRDERGTIVNYVAVKRDVTRELQLEEQYYQAQKMEAVGQLTAGIAHDFNNLLTAINGFAELMQLQLPPEDPLQELVGQLLSSGRRAAALIRQLLTFSRRQIIEPQVLNLNDVVIEMERMLRRVIGENIELETVLAPNLWPVEVDRAQMEQVVVNLAVNARDAMPNGGKLIIETANVVLDDEYVARHLEVQPGEHVLLSVSDNGVGMSLEVKAHLFEPFFTTKERGKGTGLGLATVYGIVKQSGGSIWVYSEEGEGTTFKIYLPRAKGVPQPLRPPEAGREIPSGVETVLVVEDDDGVRELAQRVLQRQGYTVLTARNGQEALELSNRHPTPIHLLLTDVIMPGLSGRELAEQLQAHRPDLKLLFMSGYTDEAIARHGVLSPGVALVQKPFSPVELARKVRAVLDE